MYFDITVSIWKKVNETPKVRVVTLRWGVKDVQGINEKDL